MQWQKSAGLQKTQTSQWRPLLTAHGSWRISRTSWAIRSMTAAPVLSHLWQLSISKLVTVNWAFGLGILYIFTYYLTYFKTFLDGNRCSALHPTTCFSIIAQLRSNTPRPLQLMSKFTTTFQTLLHSPTTQGRTKQTPVWPHPLSPTLWKMTIMITTLYYQIWKTLSSSSIKLHQRTSDWFTRPAIRPPIQSPNPRSYQS